TGRYYVERKVVPRDLLYLPATQKLAIIGRLDSEYSFLLKADTSGQFFEAINFKDIDLYQLIYDKAGGFYALGSTQLKADLSENKADLVLLKFNAGFELQW